MTREEYIESVVSEIKDKAARAEIAEEIGAHLDDRIKFYTDAGYDYDYALSKAIGKMGDGEEVSRSMSRLYDRNAVIRECAAVVLLMIFKAFGTIMAYLVSNSCFSKTEIAIEGLTYAMIFGFLILALERKRKSVSYLISAEFAIYFFGKFFFGAGTGSGKMSSGIAFLIYYALTGRLKEISDISGRLADVKAGAIIIILSVLLYAFVLIAIIFTINELNKINNGKNKMRDNRSINITIWIFTVLSLIFTAAAVLTTEFIPDHTFERGSDSVVILESDKKCDIQEVEKDDWYLIPISKLDNSDYFTVYRAEGYLDCYLYIDGLDSKKVYKKYDKNFSYKINNNYIVHTPKHKYVYILPANYTETAIINIEYDEKKWVETNSEHEFEFPVEQGKYAVNVNHIKVKTKEN